METTSHVSSPGPEPLVHALFENSTHTWQWVVADPVTSEAVVIDPVLDKDPNSSGISTTAADRVLHLVREQGYHVSRILETHGQRNTRTAAWYLRTQFRDSTGNMPRICTGNAIAGVQRMFARQYGIRDAGWSSRFNSFQDGQVFTIGKLKCQVLQLSGQCPSSFGFVIGHNLFLGDVTHGGRDSTSIIRGGEPAFERQPSVVSRLAQFADGYLFHPPGGEGGRHPEEESRPPTSFSMRTDVSSWQHEPMTPKGSMSLDRHVAATTAQYTRAPSQTEIYEMA